MEKVLYVPAAVKALLRGEGISQHRIGNLLLKLQDHASTHFSIDNRFSMHPTLIVNSTLTYNLSSISSVSAAVESEESPSLEDSTAVDPLFDSFLFLHEVNDLWYVNPVDLSTSSVQFYVQVSATAANAASSSTYSCSSGCKSDDPPQDFAAEGQQEKLLATTTIPVQIRLHSVLEQYSGETVACYHHATNRSAESSLIGLEVVLLQRQAQQEDISTLVNAAAESDQYDDDSIHWNYAREIYMWDWLRSQLPAHVEHGKHGKHSVLVTEEESKYKAETRQQQKVSARAEAASVEMPAQIQVQVQLSYRLPLHMRYASLCKATVTSTGSTMSTETLIQENSSSFSEGHCNSAYKGNSMTTSLSADDQRFLNRKQFISTEIEAPTIYAYRYQYSRSSGNSNNNNNKGSHERLLRPGLIRVFDDNCKVDKKGNSEGDIGGSGCDEDKTKSSTSSVSAADDSSSSALPLGIGLVPIVSSPDSIATALVFIPTTTAAVIESEGMITHAFVARVNLLFVLLASAFLIFMIMRKNHFM